MDATSIEATSGTWLPSARHILGLAGLWLVFKVLEAIYNISPLHPLSSIPGPRLAAATYWPEFYHDVVKFGCYTKEISKMHRVYGEFITAYLIPARKLIKDLSTRTHRANQPQRSPLRRHPLRRRDICNR